MTSPPDDEFLSADEHAAALDPAIGAGTADTAPHETPDIGLLAAQPAATIGTVVAAIDAVLVAGVPLPAGLTALLVAVVTIAGALGIRSRVTPVAVPRLDDETPLTL